MKINHNSDRQSNLGFTIVELLISIVIIAILAAIVIVSYRGITTKANEATLQSDLSNAKKQFALYYTEHGTYPTGLNGNKCPTGTVNPSPDTNYCLKPSSGDVIEISEADGIKYKLTATKGNLVYTITEGSSPIVYDDSVNWITIGTQKWAKKNLNVGTRINGSLAQINNGGTNVVEKYCYGDTDAGCTNTDANGVPYGGLYQWDEAMGYSTTEGAQGICPAGSHIPSDNDWKVLEVTLGMTQAQADTSNAWRGTDQGTKLKSGGTSGLNMPLAGSRYTNGSFLFLSSHADLWSSSESSTSAWLRGLDTSQADVGRYMDVKAYGFSVRCLGN